MESLRRLDDRVIGTNRKPKREQAKKSFLLGLGGCIVVLALVALFRRPWILSGIGGFVGIMLGGAVRWWHAARDPVERRAIGLLSSLAGLVLVGVIVAFATMGKWAVETNSPTQQPLDPYRNSRTMVVLCAGTAQGDAYTYQAPAADTPKCRNGAVPKVVVRG